MLSSTNWIKSLRTSRRSMTRNHMSDYRSRSDSHRASPMPRNKVQGYLTTQRNPSVCFTGDYAYFLSCRLLIQIESVCRMPSVDKSTNTSTCLRGKVCAKTFKSCVGSGDSSTQDKPEPLTTLYIVERELACFACLCYHSLH